VAIQKPVFFSGHKAKKRDGFSGARRGNLAHGRKHSLPKTLTEEKKKRFSSDAITRGIAAARQSEVQPDFLKGGSGLEEKQRLIA